MKVDQTTQDVDACVKEMRDADERNRDEMREIREEVNSIREMLPKVRIRRSKSDLNLTLDVAQMMDKNKESQSQSLAELQQELKSLKALLLSRGPSFPSAPSPSLPSLVGRPSIPAWQLAGTSPSSETPPSIQKTNGLSSGRGTPPWTPDVDGSSA